MPSIGELIRIPFHVTCVCEGDVPRNATVERVARPYCLTKIDVLKVRMSAIERAMFSCSTVVSSWVFWMPISFIGRRAVTLTSRMGTAYEGLLFHHSLFLIFSSCASPVSVVRHSTIVNRCFIIWIRLRFRRRAFVDM